MEYELKFEYVALAIAVTILIIQFFYRDFPTRLNRLFTNFLILEILSVSLDIISVWVIEKPQDYSLSTGYFVNILYSLALHSLPCMYYIFSVAMTHEAEDFKIYHWIFMVVPLLFNYISILTTPLTHFVFYYDENMVYCHNTGMVLIYIIEIVYVLLLSPYEIIHNYRKITARQTASVILYTIIAVLATIYQFLHPYVLTIGIGIAFSLFIGRLTLRNFMEYVDAETEAYNINALREYFFTSASKKKNTSIGIIHIVNKNVINKKFGSERTSMILKEFLNALKDITGEKNFFFLFQDTFLFVDKDKDKANRELESLIRQKATLTGLESTVDFQCWLFEDILDVQEKRKGRLEIDKIIDVISFSIYKASSDRTEKNRVKVIDGKTIGEFARLSHIEEKVNEAIKENSFEVYLQPIYNLHTGTYTSAESLIRLRDDDGKFISPEDFIMNSEKNGQILEIGDISLRKTCEFINTGKLKDLGISKVNVNLSTVQCMQSNIVEHLLSILEEYKVPFEMIRFEITESFLENDGDSLLSVMNSFCEKGIEFALDDYGTGFSNVSRLITLPFTEIKFDKSIVYAAMESERNEQILSHLMGMVKASTLKILAEGVETEKLLALLKRLGADYIQGWYFSKALPVEDFIKEVNLKNNGL